MNNALIRTITAFLVLAIFGTTSIYAQCSIETEVDIPDLTPISATIEISGAINNDLSTSQGVCGLALEFEHDHIGDLTIQLESPDGQIVTLLGPTGSFGNTSFTDWNVLFVPCAVAPAPDAGFLGQWNNNQNWGLLGDYNGSYHPYLGCLEDFNIGSVNGVWNISILDNTQFDLGKLLNATIFFCEQEGLACNACEADAGVFNESQAAICSDNVNDFQLEPSFPNGQPSDEYVFHYLVRQDETILDISEDLDISVLAIGDYQICGLSLSAVNLNQIDFLSSLTYSELIEEIEGATPTICGDLNENCFELSITSSFEPVDISVTICEGDSYEIGGNSYSIEDDYVVTVSNPNGCDSIYNLSLTTTDIQALVTAQNTVISCSSNELELVGDNSETSPNSIFSWSTTGGGFNGPTDEANVIINQAGNYILSVIDGNCISTSSIIITVNDDVPELEIIGGTITCNNPAVNIELNSDIALVSTSWTGPNSFMSSDEDITVTDPGVYTVTVESTNGCIATKSININSAGEEPVLQLSAINISCGCSASFQIEITGSSDILEYELSYDDLMCASSNNVYSVEIDDADAQILWTLPNGSTSTGTSLLSQQTGEFFVLIQSNGCSTLDSFTVNTDYDDLPVAVLSQSNIIDCDNPTAVLSADIIENADNVSSVQWVHVPLGSVISNDFQVVVDLGGQYALFVYSEDGCAVRFNIILQFNPIVPTASILPDHLTCINDNASIDAFSDQDLDYSWSGPNSFTSQDSFIQNLEIGLYDLVVTDGNSCSRSYAVNLLADTIAPPMNLISEGNLDCNLDTTEVNPSFPAVNSISWTSTTGLMSNDYQIEVFEPGFYFFEAIVDRNGCIAHDTIEITLDLTEPNLEVEDQSFNCGQGSLFLEATSSDINVLFNWTGPNNFISNVKNPIITEPGMYTVVATKPNGCTTTRTISVTEDNVLPDVEASFTNDLDCVLTQTDIIGSSSTNDVSFEWQGPNNFFSDQPVVSVEVAGEYIFLVTGSNGCKDSTILEIPFTGSYPEFEALGDTLFCGETTTTIDVDAVTNGVSYTWTGPNSYMSGDQSNTVVDSGMYIVMGIGSNNCVTLDTSYVVFDNQPAIISLANELDTLSCDTLSQFITIETDKAFVTTNWTGPNSFNSNDQNIEVVDGGLYQFIGISANQCEVTLDVNVIQNINLPVISLEGEDLNCDNTKALISVDNLDIGATYEWSGPNFYTSSGQNTIVEEIGVYEVLVTGTNGCQTIDSIEIFADFEDPIITVEDDTLPCDGTPIPLFLETESTNVTFQWIGPNGFDSTSQNPLTNVPGIYFIEVVGPNGCSANETVELSDVPIYADYEITKSNEITCDTRTVTLNAFETEDDLSFFWTTPTGEEITDESFESMDAGTYYFNIFGITGCETLDSIEVKLDTLFPTIEIEQTGILLCEVDELSISGAGTSVGVEFFYQWTTDDGEIVFGDNSIDPVISGEGTYRLYVEDQSNGCGFFKEIEISEEVSTLESVDLNIEMQTCSGLNDGVIEIVNVQGGIAPYRYAFPGTSHSQINSIENLEAGEYLISIKDTFGCEIDTLINLGVEKDLDVDLGDDLDIDLGEIVNIEALTNFPTNQIDSLVWTPSEVIDCIGCLSYEFMPEGNTQVTIFIKDFDGCITTDQMVIRVDESVNLFIPNIFTPNDDGINDIWSLSESSNIEMINHFSIYDRWGNRVFFDEGDGNGFIPGFGKNWDGRHNGRAVQQGVFVYLAEIKLVNGRTRIIKGNITVMR